MGILNSEEDRQRKHTASNRDDAIRELIKAVSDLKDYVWAKSPPSSADRLLDGVDAALGRARDACG